MDDEPDASSRADHLRPCAASHRSHRCSRKISLPRLGDFAKLQCHAAALLLEHTPRSSSNGASGTAGRPSGDGGNHPLRSSTRPDAPTKLGDFFRLFAHLQTSGPATKNADQKCSCRPKIAFSPSSMPCTEVLHAAGDRSAPWSVRTASPDKPFSGSSGSGSDIKLCSEPSNGVDNGALTPCTTPQSSTDFDATSFARSSERRAEAELLKTSTEAPPQKRRSNVGHVVSYQRTYAAP